MKNVKRKKKRVRAYVIGANISGRALELALPSLGSPAQQRVLAEMAEYASTRENPVELIIRIIE